MPRRAEITPRTLLRDPVYGRADPQGMLLHSFSLSLPRPGKAAVAAEAPVPARFGGFA